MNTLLLNKPNTPRESSSRELTGYVKYRRIWVEGCREIGRWKPVFIPKYHTIFCDKSHFLNLQILTGRWALRLPSTGALVLREKGARGELGRQSPVNFPQDRRSKAAVVLEKSALPLLQVYLQFSSCYGLLWSLLLKVCLSPSSYLPLGGIVLENWPIWSGECR